VGDRRGVPSIKAGARRAPWADPVNLSVAMHERAWDIDRALLREQGSIRADRAGDHQEPCDGNARRPGELLRQLKKVTTSAVGGHFGTVFESGYLKSFR